MSVGRKKRVARPVKKVAIAKGVKIGEEKIKKLKKTGGSSNIGRYSNIEERENCGPSGGAAPGTYPVNSKKRCRAALSYARHAPNPSGIRRCVARKCKNTKK